MVNNNNNNNISDDNESSHLLLFVEKEEEEKRNDRIGDNYDVMRLLSLPALLVLVLLMMVVATSSSLKGTLFGSSNSINLSSSLSSSSSSSSSSIVIDNANDNDSMVSRTQPVCMGKTNTATYGLVTCRNTNDDFTMYGRGYSKEICKRRNCEDRGGKYDDSDFQCDPHPRSGSTGCTTNIKCCDIYTPEPVPSAVDKNRYGIKYCGKLNAPDGRTVTVPQAIYETNESGRQIVFQVHGIGDVDKKIVADSRQQTLRAFDTYLWGGSCHGKCVKKGGTASCTY